MMDRDAIAAFAASLESGGSDLDPTLPSVAAAIERDRAARARLGLGLEYKPTAGEALEDRAWRGRGGFRF